MAKKPKVPAKKKPIFPDSEVLEEIRKSYKKKKLIPFIGAGFPQNIGNFPDWDDFVKGLTKELADKCGSNFGGKTLSEIFPHNIRATEYYVLKIGEKTAKERSEILTIKNIFIAGKDELSAQLRLKFSGFTYNGSDTAKREWQVYREFIGLENFQVIYTTNWDGSIETISDALLEEDKRYALIYTDKTLRESLAKGKQRLLIKYHGHYSFGKSIVAAESDYFHRMMHKNMLDVKLFHDLLHYDFLFIGWSFDDIFIRLTVSQVSDMLRGTSEEDLPKMFMVHVGKLHPIMDDYFKFNHITAFCICEECKCKHLKKIQKNDDCKDLAKQGQCSLKDYFVRLFRRLKEVE